MCEKMFCGLWRWLRKRKNDAGAKLFRSVVLVGCRKGGRQTQNPFYACGHAHALANIIIFVVFPSFVEFSRISTLSETKKNTKEGRIELF